MWPQFRFCERGRANSIPRLIIYIIYSRMWFPIAKLFFFICFHWSNIEKNHRRKSIWFLTLSSVNVSATSKFPRFSSTENTMTDEPVHPEAILAYKKKLCLRRRKPHCFFFHDNGNTGTQQTSLPINSSDHWVCSTLYYNKKMFCCYLTWN